MPKVLVLMEFKRKFNMEDSPPPPRPITPHWLLQSTADPHSSSANHLPGHHLKTLCMENTSLLLCFDPPPPLLHHGLPTPSIPRPTPPPGSDPRGGRRT
ncbi:hypothetical protein CHARACLAT_013945 [Characodon lateralis]|uniref:Uncharacterized protein n=1 Tax=Characodon lateralis TaxID=208331 RepID=A0ABU7DV06_9TELE|nr:hypothetical protein [Characodon lateralis]